jgi:hypothetical protein
MFDLCGWLNKDIRFQEISEKDGLSFIFRVLLYRKFKEQDSVQNVNTAPVGLNTAVKIFRDGDF